jgi:hypothetical protein
MGVMSAYQISKLDLRQACGMNHSLQDPLRGPDKLAHCFVIVNYFVHVAIVTSIVADVK